jgi:hypothetical protein
MLANRLPKFLRLRPKMARNHLSFFVIQQRLQRILSQIADIAASFRQELFKECCKFLYLPFEFWIRAITHPPHHVIQEQIAKPVVLIVRFEVR